VIVSAARVFPVAGAPVESGAVRLMNGLITAIGPAKELVPRFPRERHETFPDCVMIPGLVNAHTHLEYTALAALARPRDFIPWIRDLVECTRVREKFWGPSYWVDSASAGAAKSLRSGITTVGDVVTFGASPEAAADSGIRMRAYLEMVAVGHEGLDDALSRLDTLLGSSVFRGDRISPGISPHSIYTLSPRALFTLSSLAAGRSLPLAVHVAETSHEADLLRGTGKLAGQIERWHLPFSPAYTGSFTSYLGDASLLTKRSLLVHAVHLGENELAEAAAAESVLVTCPRSNIRLGCGLPDYPAWRKAGVRFCYGTDSLASAPSFDLFAEARTVRGFLEEDAAVVLRRLTLGGAEALELDGVAGSLVPGKAADLVLLRLPPGTTTEDDVVTMGSPERVAATMVGGRFLYRSRLPRSRSQQGHDPPDLSNGRVRP
jgi:5-methylthioadenosine/S-adenosylhomocysteine deaminase